MRVPLVAGAGRNSPAGMEFRRRYRHMRRVIGANIKNTRHHQRMSLKSLARKTGIGAAKLDHYELGRSEINLAVIIRIAAALYVPPARLFEPERARNSISQRETSV